MNKKAIFSSLLLAFTSIATANHGGSGGLIGLISNFPFPVDNWREIAISAATFGLIWFTVYMIVKKLIMRFELEDLFNMGGSGAIGGGDGGRNLGAVLSLLIVVSAAGASHTYLGFTIDTIQQTLLLAVGFLVASLIILVLGGGAGLFMFSTGKAAKAGAWGLNELDEGANAGSDEYDDQDIEAVRERTSQAQDVATRAEHEEEDVTSGQSEDPEQESDQAAHDVEKVIELVESSEQTLSGMMKKDLDEFEQAIEDAQQILQQDQEEEKSVKDIKARLDDVNNELNKANSDMEPPVNQTIRAQALGQGGRGAFSNFKGLKTLDEELQGVQEDIKLIESLETKEEEEMEDEVHILVNKLEEFVVLQNLLSRIKQEIGEAEELDEYLESISQEIGSEKVYKEAEQEEKQIEQMKSYYQELMSEEERLEELIERAKDLIKNEIKLEEGEIQQLQELVKEDGRILNQLEALEENVLKQLGNADDYGRTWRRMENMQDNLNKIGQHLEKIEQQNEQEEAAEERLLNKFADL